MAREMTTTFPHRSWPMAALQLYFQLRGKAFGDEAGLRRRVLDRPTPEPAAVSRRLQRRCEVVTAELDGRRVYTLTPRRNREDRHIVYTHGGGYVNPLIWPHWAIIDRLIAVTNATVTVPLFPLAPHHTYQEAFPWLERVYQQVLTTTRPEAVTLCGDSAGGGLALAQALHLRDRGLPLPGRLILFAPWLDVTMADPAAGAVEPHDAMLALSALRLAGRWWAGEDDPRTPLVSPLYGDLAGLPPIDVFQGTADVLAPDARTLAAKVAAAGGMIQLYEYPGAIHVFMGATFTPEARDVYARIGASFG